MVKTARLHHVPSESYSRNGHVHYDIEQTIVKNIHKKSFSKNRKLDDPSLSSIFILSIVLISIRFTENFD